MAEIIIRETETFKEYEIMCGDEIIGTAEIKFPEMTLNNFFIYPQYRNKGYGQKAIEQFIKDFGITNLWVNVENEIARHIYEKSGFVVDDTPKYISMKVKGGE